VKVLDYKEHKAKRSLSFELSCGRKHKEKVHEQENDKDSAHQNKVHDSDQAHNKHSDNDEDNCNDKYNGNDNNNDQDQVKASNGTEHDNAIDTDHDKDNGHDKDFDNDKETNKKPSSTADSNALPLLEAVVRTSLIRKGFLSLESVGIVHIASFGVGLESFCIWNLGVGLGLSHHLGVGM
jgi:hypothetical protein